jgi:hypothetical protein
LCMDMTGHCRRGCGGYYGGWWLPCRSSNGDDGIQNPIYSLTVDEEHFNLVSRRCVSTVVESAMDIIIEGKYPN